MCKFIKYGVIFFGGFIAGIAAVASGACILASKCDCDDLDDFDEEIDEDLEI